MSATPTSKTSKTSSPSRVVQTGPGARVPSVAGIASDPSLQALLARHRSVMRAAVVALVVAVVLLVVSGALSAAGTVPAVASGGLWLGSLTLAGAVVTFVVSVVRLGLAVQRAQVGGIDD